MNKNLFITMTLCLISIGIQANSFYTPFQFHKDSAVQKHSPKKASIYSAILPGTGQMYNRKYWKVPLVYGAIGTSTYFLFENRYQLRIRQTELIAREDNDVNTVPSASFAKSSTDVLKSERNYYRKMRDYSILATAAFYVLNIVDAAVDAHFYKFDINQPLSVRNQRHLHLYAGNHNGYNQYGLAWRF